MSPKGVEHTGTSKIRSAPSRGESINVAERR